MPDLTADDLLRTADALLSSGVPGTRGLWPRTAAFLTRMALEQAVGEFWARTYPALAECSMRAQLLCAASYLPRETVQALAVTWNELSEACHYHTYELAPTSAELRRWCDETGKLIGRLTQSPPPATEAGSRRGK